jgi:hypothetical protein
MRNFEIYTQKVSDSEPVLFAQMDSPNNAMAAANALFKELCKDTRLTVSVREKDLPVDIHELSNAFIKGVFNKQRWDDNDFLHDEGSVDFDATHAVLSLNYEAFQALTDNSDESDYIGRQVVEWDGPFSVEIEEGICCFFGVEHVDDISSEMFAKAQRETQRDKMQDREITLTVALSLSALEGLNAADILASSRLHFEVGLPGVLHHDLKVTDFTEIK